MSGKTPFSLNPGIDEHILKQLKMATRKFSHGKTNLKINFNPFKFFIQDNRALESRTDSNANFTFQRTVLKFDIFL